MTPRLVLLTGPAAGEVAGVFSWGCKPREVFQFVNDNIQQAQWWDEVRDYWEAPNVIAGLPDAVAVEHGIRSLPGGEAWLVGLVLPAAHMTEPLHLTCGHSSVGKTFSLDCEACRIYRRLPRRLAILAPNPPALLVERVRAWGGDVWWCVDNAGCCIGSDTLQDLIAAHEKSWPEAVRAALGDPS